jgi:uncharacterized membrane protein YccC
MMDWKRLEVRLGNATALAFRLTAAALLALWLAHRLKVALPLWSVLTALVVTQISLGRSWKATLDYFAGTLVGVLWGACVAVLVPHTTEASLLLVLLLALAPLAYAASLYPWLSVGPITAAIVVLLPEMLHNSPIDSATERVSEVLLGGLAGLFVSFVLVPWSAFQHTRELASQSLERMAKAIPGLIAGFEHGLDDAEAHRLQDGIGHQLSLLASVVAEAERERPLRMAADPLTGPLFRTLLRLRHDLVILGRAARSPLPASLKDSLHAPLLAVGGEMGGHLQACATALMAKREGPPRANLDAALTRYTTEIETLRQAGELRKLASDDVERLYASVFALEQTRMNLADLDRCMDEWAHRR